MLLIIGCHILREMCPKSKMTAPAVNEKSQIQNTYSYSIVIARSVSDVAISVAKIIEITTLRS
jgi:hypothetical protein